MTVLCFAIASPCGAPARPRTNFLCRWNQCTSFPIRKGAGATGFGSVLRRHRSTLMVMIEDESGINSDAGAAGTAPPVDDPTKPVLYTECGKCKAAYKLDESDLGDAGRRVQCCVCGNVWFQRAEKLLTLGQDKGMKDYPMEKKEEIMRRAAESFAARKRASANSNGRYRDRGRRGQGNGGDSASERKPPYSRRRAGGGEFAIFIGNVSYDATEQELEDFISVESKPERVSLVTDQNGRCKGFGFADMSSAAEMERVIDNLNGRTLLGRPVSIREGKKRMR